MDELKSRALEIVDVIAKASERIIEETKDLAEVSRLKYDIRVASHEVNSLKITLADRLLELYSANISDEKAINIIATINAKLEEIEKLNARVDIVRGKVSNTTGIAVTRTEENDSTLVEQQTVACPKCNGEVPVEFLYCNHCGYKFD